MSLLEADGDLTAAVRVAELAAYELEVPAAGGEVALSGGRRADGFLSTVVRVTAQDGLTGWGEACTMGSAYLDGFAAATVASVRALAPVVLGADPMAAWPVVRAMDRAVVGHQPGKAALDAALWDLRGRRLEQPVAALLGGIAQTTLPAFAAVSVGSPAATVTEARALVASGGRRLQVKVGDEPVADAERVRAVARAVGGDLAYLCADANRGWTTAEARRFVRALGDVDCWLEQPCATLEELEALRAAVTLPLVVDESARTARDLLRSAAGGIDAVNLKPTRVGGLTRAAHLRDLAETLGLMVLVDEPMGGALASAAVAHLAATVDPERLLGASHPGHQGAAPGDGARLLDGHVHLPQGPGLGVTPDPELLGDLVALVCARQAA